MEVISSIKDERIISDRELISASGRHKHKCCQIDGMSDIMTVMEAGARVIRVYFSGRPSNGFDVPFLEAQGVQCFQVSEGIMKKLIDTNYVVPILGIVEIPDNTQIIDDFVVVMDQVLDHGNVGTIIRSAAAFGVKSIVSTDSKTDFFYKKMISASRGAVFRSKIMHFDNPSATINYLRENGYQIIASSPHSPNLISKAQLQDKPVALVVGNETNGICDEIMKNADLVVQIPMYGRMESLNVGVAAGISLYELKFRMVIAMLKGLICSNIGREINVTSKMIISALNKPVKESSGFDSMQVILLMILKCDEQMTLRQVSRDTALFGEELHSFLKPMFEHEYIVLHKDDNGDYIELTKEGEKAISELWPVIESVQVRILDGFTSEEESLLRDFLTRIKDNCDAIEAES